jgi:hypothetical protein
MRSKQGGLVDLADGESHGFDGIEDPALFLMILLSRD